ILQKELGIDPEASFQPIIARVTHRNLSAWWQELSLRKGTNQKIFPGMGVVFSHGIVGRIKRSGFNSSKVELCTNPNFRIVAHFQGDDRPVTFQGDGILPGGKPIGVVLDVPHDITIEKGKPLFLKTSALGGTFPSGLHIGTVRMLEESGDGLFKNGKVILHKDLGKVPEVSVLRPTPPQGKQE
uniref:rod shape-determining protein MreC n=1 Tax=Candidatus Chordibacter forsetii TaxID=3381758 RepID=UPI00389984B4